MATIKGLMDITPGRMFFIISMFLMFVFFLIRVSAG